MTDEFRAGLLRIGNVRNPREYGERHCADEGNEPDDGQDLCGPSDAGHSVRVKRMANGQVALQREGHDRQHRRVVGPELNILIKIKLVNDEDESARSNRNVVTSCPFNLNNEDDEEELFYTLRNLN